MEDKSFGVILGPTGTGKTFAIQEACLKNPQGTLYYEIGGVHEFPKVLAEAVGMRVEPTVTGVLLGKYFPSFRGYFQLPSNYTECLDFVIRTLGERAAIYKRKNGRPPCLFIDGADLLAKYEAKTFIKLVDMAKKYANAGGLRIVFGCSEGHIIPLINDTSSKTRCRIIEVPDLREKESVAYLVKCGLREDSAVKVVKGIGSRLIFLDRAVEFYHAFSKQHNYGDEEKIIEEVVSKLELIFTERGIYNIILELPNSMDVIKHLLNFESKIGFEPKDFIQGYGNVEKREAIRRTMESLVQHNALRFTSDGRITWHSTLMETKVKERFFVK